LFDPGRGAAACLDFTSTKLGSTATEIPIIPSQEGVSMSSHDIYRAAPLRIAVMHITLLHNECHAFVCCKCRLTAPFLIERAYRGFATRRSYPSQRAFSCGQPGFRLINGLIANWKFSKFHIPRR
jgi:hypothetical protein